MYCANCKQRCHVVRYDDSFDHEYGTEYRYHFGSDCCDADIYRSICNGCDGAGFNPSKFNEICLDCEGIGLLCEISVSELSEICNEGGES